MFTFDKIVRIEKDKSKATRVWVSLIDETDKEERVMSLKFSDIPKSQERNKAIQNLIQYLNSIKYVPKNPEWDGQFPDNIKNFLQNHGVWKIVINEIHEILL